MTIKHALDFRSMLSEAIEEFHFAFNFSGFDSNEVRRVANSDPP